MQTILSLGEMMVELALRPDGSAQVGFGGDTYNTAVYLSRLGCPTTYLTAFGDDAFSADARAALAAEAVSDAPCPTLPGRTMGLYAIRTDAAGERSFTYWRDRSPARDLFGAGHAPGVAAAIGGAGMVYLSGISLWLYDAAGLDRLFALLAEARAGGTRVAFDGNYRPRLWGAADRSRARATYARMLALTDICLATHDDEAALWDDADPGASLRRLTGLGVGEVVVKCGPDGALVGTGTLVPATRNPAPVDTTSAGDSFNAGYLAARLAGLDAVAAAGQGNHLAGAVIAHPGAIIPRDKMPAMDRVARGQARPAPGNTGSANAALMARSRDWPGSKGGR